MKHPCSRRAALTATILALTTSSCADSGERSNAISVPATGSSVVNLCEGLITHRQPLAIDQLAKPEPLKSFIDPAFGTKVTRISDTQLGEVVKPQYNTIQAWNSDETRILLYHTGDDSRDRGHHIYDGFTYQHIEKLDIVAVDLEQVYWHHSDPDTIIYTSANYKYYGELVRYNITSKSKERIADFRSVCGEDALPTSGNGVMMPPLNDDLFGFRCNTGSETTAGFSYKISTGEIQTLALGDGTDYDPWTAPMPTASGKYFFVTDKVLEKDLSTVRFSLDLSEFHSHSSLGKRTNGNDALFATAFDPSPRGCDGGPDRGVGSLVVHDFEDKTCNVIIGESYGYGYPGSGTHVSAVGYNAPSWALMSTIGYGQFEYLSNNEPAPVLFSEVYLVDTDNPNHTACRVAHHRSYGKDAENAEYSAYFGEPHATLSPSGTRLLYGSDWYNSGSVDTYVVELPAFKAPL